MLGIQTQMSKKYANQLRGVAWIRHHRVVDEIETATVPILGEVRGKEAQGGKAKKSLGVETALTARKRGLAKMTLKDGIQLVRLKTTQMR